jgi:hypothetical protein
LLIKEQPSYEDKNKMEKKIMVSVRSGDGKDALVTFSMGSFAVKVLGLLRAADLTQPVSFVGGAFDVGTKKTLADGTETVREQPEAFLYGVQNGEKLKATFSDDPNFKIPKVDKIDVKNPVTQEVIQTVSDPTARNNFALELAKEIIVKVDAAAKGQPSIAPAPATAPLPHPEQGDVEGAQLTGNDLGLTGMEEDGGTSDAEQFGSHAPA